jgi:hypothetical protein
VPMIRTWVLMSAMFCPPVDPLFLATLFGRVLGLILCK